jgi:choline kinase
VNGKSIIERQLETMHACGIKDEDITIITGYCSEVLQKKFKDTRMNIIVNKDFETTNMVCSLMCAKDLMREQDDILISYGDIIYNETVLQKILHSQEESSVIVDDGWYEYWSERCENPLDDAETLMFDGNDYLTEIGQKTTELSKVQSQYIGLMRFRENGLKNLLALAEEAEQRTKNGIALWRTSRTYQKMYMTDLLQGLIDEGNKLKAVHINRGWFEIDDCDDLKVVESKLK